jgi:hypothetical protein
MLVRCIKGYSEILIEGQVYNVIEVTKQGNYHLEGVTPPEGFNCFHQSRFELKEDLFSDWTEELEREYWAEQPVSYTGA